MLILPVLFGELFLLFTVLFIAFLFQCYFFYVKEMYYLLLERIYYSVVTHFLFLRYLISMCAWHGDWRTIVYCTVRFFVRGG